MRWPLIGFVSAGLLRGRQLRLDSSRDRLRDFVLQREDIGDLAVVALIPHVATRGPVDQTNVDSNSVSRPPHAAAYEVVGTELGRDATPLEAGLNRFVDLDKEFHGKAAMVVTGIRSMCVTLLIDGPDDTDPWGREAPYHGDTRVGRLTSGGY